MDESRKKRNTQFIIVLKIMYKTTQKVMGTYNDETTTFKIQEGLNGETTL